MSVYGLLVRNRRSERARRERGLSAARVSALTWTADDRRAWDVAYRAAVDLCAARHGASDAYLHVVRMADGGDAIFGRTDDGEYPSNADHSRKVS